LIVVALTLLLAVVLLLLLRYRKNQLELASVADEPDGSFVVQVERPVLSGRPIWEVPRAILGTGDRDLRFGHMSASAAFGAVGSRRLELNADGGWDLLIESDGRGRVTEGTRLLFTLILFDRQLKLNCRPADSEVNHFNTTARAGSDKLDGNFFLYLTQCKNAESGKNTAGLPAFTVRGSFKGLPQSGNVKDEGKGTK
jgi:hypothetical protein